MKSEILLTLIKEVIKKEVKQQVKEELAKLIKSGAVTLNSQRKTTSPTLREVSESTTPNVKKQQPIVQQQRPQIKKEFTKDPMINEILNMTQPFTSEQRKEGAQSVGSVLDMIKPELRVDESEWETLDYRDMDIPSNIPNFESTGDGLQDATIKALTRDYSELVKRFK
jgi:Rps23 Pro-64 3,4-dihydroxylase Tpa1-like proline 4-hydroxylase